MGKDIQYTFPDGKDIRCPVRIGIIGCGYWGSKLLRVFNSLKTADVVYVCDQKSQKRTWIADDYPDVNFLTDYRPLLESDCEAIVIATPAASHHCIASESLRAHKHVFVEKPLALNRSEAEDLKNIAQNHGSTLFVGHTFEFDPAIIAIRNIIASGELGKVFYVDSIRSNLGLIRLDINIIWDLLVHDISILNTIFGDFPVEVSAIGSCHVTQGTHDICESCQVNMILPQGFRASARASWLEPIKTRQLKIIGSQKSLVYDATIKDAIQIYDGGIDIHTLNSEVDINYRQGTRSGICFSEAEPLTVEAHAFINSILEGDTTNAQIAVDIIGVLDAIQTSLDNNGNWVQVDLESSNQPSTRAAIS